MLHPKAGGRDTGHPQTPGGWREQGTRGDVSWCFWSRAAEPSCSEVFKGAESMMRITADAPSVSCPAPFSCSHAPPRARTGGLYSPPRDGNGQSAHPWLPLRCGPSSDPSQAASFQTQSARLGPDGHSGPCVLATGAGSPEPRPRPRPRPMLEAGNHASSLSCTAGATRADLSRPPLSPSAP